MLALTISGSMNATPSVVPLPNSSGANEELERTEEISDVINLYIPPILIVIGTVCNTFTVLTMRTRYFRSMSTSVYLTAGAVNDGLSLLVALLAHWLYVNFPDIFIRTESSHIMCKFFNFYGWGNTDLGIMITMCMTTERAVAIASPLKAVKRCTIKRARIVVAIITSIVVTKEFHFWFSSDMVPQERSERLCDVFPPTESYRKFWLYVWPWIHVAFLTICFIIMIVSNAIIVYHVRKSVTDQQTGGQKWRQLASMLIGESLLLLVLTFPFTVHLSRLAIQSQYDSTIYSDPDSAAREKLIFSVTFYMLYSNKCANFFNYCMLGARFRQGLLHVLRNCCLSKTALREKRRSDLLHSATTRRISGAYSIPSHEAIENGPKLESKIARSRKGKSIRLDGRELKEAKRYAKHKQANSSSPDLRNGTVKKGSNTPESNEGVSNEEKYNRSVSFPFVNSEEDKVHTLESISSHISDGTVNKGFLSDEMDTNSSHKQMKNESVACTLSALSVGDESSPGVDFTDKRVQNGKIHEIQDEIFSIYSLPDILNIRDSDGVVCIASTHL